MSYPHYPALFATAIVAALLGACNRPPDSETVGRKIDRSVDSTKQAAGDMAKDVKSAATQTADGVADTARDITITAKVKTELAKDSDLSAMAINVDTSGGRVALNGTAPDAAARDRATALATAVEGVKSVDNRLDIKSKSKG